MKEKIPNNNPSSFDNQINRRDFLKKLGLIGGAIAASQIPLNVFGNEFEKNESIKINRMEEEVIHKSGTIYKFKSIGQNGEYYPSFNNSLLKEKESPSKLEISGNFSKNLKIKSRFATFIDKEPINKIEDLLLKHNDKVKVNDKLISHIKNLSQDSYIFEALKQFFEDGGIINTGRGRLIPVPLEIQFGNHEDANQNERILYHELLHYIFARKNSKISESSAGGTDHFIISPLEEKLSIIQSIKKGEVPVNKEIKNLYGYTIKGKEGDKIREFINSNNLEKLKSHLLYGDFFKNFIHSGMIEPLSSVESNKNTRNFRLKLSNGKTFRVIENYKQKNDDSIVENNFSPHIYIDAKINNIENFNIKPLDSFIEKEDRQKVNNFIEKHKQNKNLNRCHILTKDQIHDIAYLIAQNAIYIENSFTLAIELSNKKKISLEKIFKDEEYKLIFQDFINQFTLLNQKEDNNFPARKKAQSIISELIKKL